MKIDKDIELANQRKVTEKRVRNLKDQADNASNVDKLEDSVQLTYGKAVNDTYRSLISDPERERRIQNIKGLVQSGKISDYFKEVPSENMVASLISEINQEILSAKSKVSAEEE